MSTDLIVKLRLPTEEAADLIESRFGLTANQLTGVAGGFAVPASLTQFDASTNQLPQAAIDAILAAFVAAGASNGTLTLNGTGNAAPSGSGATDKATLQSRGWTVSTN